MLRYTEQFVYSLSSRTLCSSDAMTFYIYKSEPYTEHTTIFKTKKIEIKVS